MAFGQFGEVEKMKKDKEWLKEEIKKMGLISSGSLFRLIDELDNQEVLSQKWIDEHKYNHYIGKPFVYVDDLQNLIVPKQEKPVIPQFVADYIESQDDPIYGMCIDYEMWGVNGDDGTTTFTGEIAEWFDDTLNVENYYRACIDGYEVEKEKLYIIKFAPSIYGTPTYGSIGTQNGKKIMQTVYGSQEGIIPNQYTRREIEEVGSEYMIFAEEVME